MPGPNSALQIRPQESGDTEGQAGGAHQVFCWGVWEDISIANLSERRPLTLATQHNIINKSQETTNATLLSLHKPVSDKDRMSSSSQTLFLAACYTAPSLPLAVEMQ